MHSSAGLTGGPELASGSATAPPPVPAGPESADAPQALVAGGSDAVAPTMQPVVATAVTIVDAVAVVGSIWTPPETLAPFGRKRGAPSAPSDAGNATKIGARAGAGQDSWQKEADLVKARRTMFWRSVDEQDDEAADALHRAPGTAARKALRDDKRMKTPRAQRVGKWPL